MKWLSLFLLISTQLVASEALETTKFEDVFNRVEEAARSYGRKNVLVVLDIDNTILRMPQDLGSDQWYSWQEDIMRTDACEPLCVTRDSAKLLEYQGLLFAIGKMRPTEDRLAARIRALQEQGQRIILLTSRGHDFRSVTEKALQENGFDFRASQMGASVAETYLPYELARATEYALTPDDVRLANLKTPRPVSYQNGIYMTAGQHKGAMLKVLLHKYRAQFKAIIFVDDHQRHVDRMQAIMGPIADVTTYRYGGADEHVNRFKASDKQRVTRDWQKLKSVLADIGYEQAK